MRALGDDPPDADLHAARIAVKRARYAAELAERSVGRAAAAVIRDAKLLQDVLGDHQDAHVAERAHPGAREAAHQRRPGDRRRPRDRAPARAPAGRPRRVTRRRGGRSSATRRACSCERDLPLSRCGCSSSATGSPRITSADGTDASRALTAQGVARTRAAARGLAAFADPPDVILSSPKTRALQTARAAAAAFGREVEVLADAGRRPARRRRCGRSRRAREATVMIVGHEPMLSELVEQVCTGDRRRGFVDMRKAGCACLDVAFAPGGETAAATLLWLATPKMLRGVEPG